jgi:hypothetical protein
MDGLIFNKTLYTSINDYEMIKDDRGFVLKAPITGKRYEAIKVKDHFNNLKPTKNWGKNYQVFYKTMKTLYPFFDLYDKDWSLASNPNLKNVQDESDFIEILLEVTRGLNDDHLSFTWKDKEYSPIEGIAWYKKENLQAMVGTISDHYIKDMQYSEGRIFRYGSLTENIAYVNIASCASELHELKSAKAMGIMFEDILKRLGDYEKLVIDLRFNRGGHDAVSMVLASKLAGRKPLTIERRVGKRKQVLTTPVDSEPIYKGDILVLTSSATVSAADVLIHFLSQLENVLIVGEETAGYFSDALPRILPSGLELTIPSEKYYDHEGHLLEGQGIRPHVFIPFDSEAMLLGRDHQLDWVLDNHKVISYSNIKK